MKDRKLQWMLVFGMFVCMIAVAGCSKKAPQQSAPAPAAPAASEQKAAPEAAAPAMEMKAADMTFEALCKKVVDESKAAAAGNFPATAEKAAMDGCMKAADAYKTSAKATAAMQAFVMDIMDACKDKSGKDWLACYSTEMPKAAAAASKAGM